MVVSKRTAVLALVSFAGVLACSDFLEVSDPGRYTDDALNTPIALTAVANGVEGDLASNLDDVAWATGEMSDEYMATGTWNPDFDLDLGRVDAVEPGRQLAASWLNSRTAAQKAQERFKTVMPDSADRARSWPA
jgi:hypothetical protein